MYHTIVSLISRRNFERVNAHDYEAILSECTYNIKHKFGGNHALGGERNDKEHLRQWFQRLGRVVPGLHLTVQDIWVKGWPWDTIVFIRWTATDAFPSGEPYRNHGVHVIKMRWAKVYEIDANEDSQIVARMMREKLAAGVEEAGAEMIQS